MPDLLEALAGTPTNATGGAVRIGKEREIRLEGLEAPIERVVFGVGDLWLSLVVIEPVVMLDLGNETGDLGLRVVGIHATSRMKLNPGSGRRSVRAIDRPAWRPPPRAARRATA